MEIFISRRISFCLIALILGLLLPSAAMQPARAGDRDQGLCDHSLGDPDEGIPACTRLIESDHDGANSPGYYNNRGVAKIAKGDLESAIGDFTSALDRKPNFVDAFRNRGLAHHMQRDYDAAIADFKRALKLDSKAAPLYNARGASLINKNEYDLAIADFDRAIQLDNRFAKAFYNRGQAWFLKKQFDRAIADFNAFTQLAPNDPKGYIQRGDARINRANFDAAIADFDAAIGVDQANWEAYSHRGEARRLQGDFGRALADHDKAIELNPNAEAYVNRALVWGDQGRFDRAIADCAEALLLQPKYDLAYANRGRFRRLSGGLEQAVADLDKALDLNPHSHAALSFRGDAHRERGDVDRALADFNSALRISPDFVAAYVGRGQTYEKKGDVAKAKADFEKALSLSGEIDAGLAKPAQSVAAARLAALAADEAATGATQLAERALKERTEEEKKAKADREAKERLEFEARVKAEAKEEIAARLKAELDARKHVDEAEQLPARDPGHRVALVIGNSEYRNVPALPNPQRDAKAVAATLQKLGFEAVIAENNLTRDQFRAALNSFEKKVEGADWAVIYYAGHGLEVGGVNYLIPVDAKLLTSGDAEWEGVKLDVVLRTTQQAKKLRLVMLDACRNNPFANTMKVADATRSIGRGLARIEPGKGTLVAYAAKDGEVAQDGDGKNSPYATAFLKFVVKPKLEINMLFRQIRDDVLNATGGGQEPFTYGSLPGQEFYFVAR